VHPAGRGLDIGYIKVSDAQNPAVVNTFNLADIRNENYYAQGYNRTTGALNGLQGTPATAEPLPVQQFADALHAESRVSQVIEPWRYSLSPNQNMTPSEVVDLTLMLRQTTEQIDAFNAARRSNNLLIEHRNHLHITVERISKIELLTINDFC
jgi:hypothetical protein